jgi:DNA-nicking Smr family endonuclease
MAENMARTIPMTVTRRAHSSVARGAGRRLTAEEEQLWATVARTAKPLRHANHPGGLINHKRPRAEAIQPARRKSAESSPAAAPRLRPSSTPLAIGWQEKQDVARGRIAIDARIDLHGMTQAQAHHSLLAFLRRSQQGGAKFVLVITGKGAPNALCGERGVLRKQVPLWLGLPEFRNCVLGFGGAHIAHGGDGALYVRLRKLPG